MEGPGDGISVHRFSEKLLEQPVHFHVMKLSGGFFLWIGAAPVLSNLAVSVNSRLVSTAQPSRTRCLFQSESSEARNRRLRLRRTAGMLYKGTLNKPNMRWKFGNIY
uniref:Uncharacterized protein n=1 Tax=Denticeps clupeoides TaxID=299321 RepID=A0AAY4CQN0_9TELE